MTMNGSSKIVPAETEVAEAPCVKEEPFWDEEEDHCFRNCRNTLEIVEIL
jgi:hypothetical protein